MQFFLFYGLISRVEGVSFENMSRPITSKFSRFSTNFVNTQQYISRYGHRFRQQLFKNTFLITEQSALTKRPYWRTLITGLGVGIMSGAYYYNKAWALPLPWSDARVYSHEEKKEVDRAKTLLLEAYNESKNIKYKNEEIVFLIGNTRAGKTTTIAYLMGAEFEKKNNEFVIKDNPIITKSGKSNTFYPVGKDGIESDTLYPKFYNAGGLTLCDCPGFNGLADEDDVFVNTITLEHALRSARKKKIVVVCSPDELTAAGGQAFRDNIKYICDRIELSEEEIKKSIIWVFTKISTDQDSQRLKKTIEDHQKSNCKILNNLKNRYFEFLKSYGIDPSAEKKTIDPSIEEKIKERIREIEFEDQKKYILGSIHDDNTVILGLLNSSPRASFFERIKTVKMISQKKRDSVDEEHKKKLNRIGCEIFSESFRLSREKDEIPITIKDLEKKIKDTKDDMKKLNQEYFLTSKYSEIFSDRIERLKKRKQEYEKEIEKNKKSAIVKESDSYSKEIVLDKYYRSESRAFIAGFFNWSVFNYEYPKEFGPFTNVRIVKQDPYGHFSNEKSQPELACYCTQYKGGRGKDAELEIEVLGNRNKQQLIDTNFTEENLLQRKKRLIDICDEIAHEEKTLKEINKTKKPEELIHYKNKLEDACKENQKQLKAFQDKLKAVNENFENCRDAGIAVLEITSSVDIPESAKARQFREKFVTNAIRGEMK